MAYFAGVSTETYTPDHLLAGEFPIATRKVTIASGQNLIRGAVLGKITASSKYVLSLQAASDGSETPDAILVHDANASGGDTEALVYVRGDFNESALTIGTGHTADSIREGLRVKGIHLVKVQAA